MFTVVIQGVEAIFKHIVIHSQSSVDESLRAAVVFSQFLNGGIR